MHYMLTKAIKYDKISKIVKLFIPKICILIKMAVYLQHKTINICHIYTT